MIFHLYLGPRHVRVGQAVAAGAFPRRSILAGCTWATLVIRFIMAPQVERFLGTLKVEYDRWNADANMMIYVDDGVVSTIGSTRAVECVAYMGYQDDAAMGVYIAEKICGAT